MILYRCLAWDSHARPRDPDGPLWFPRQFQGDGRHDNPLAYGCLYVSELSVSCIVEQLARFRGQRLTSALLRRRGLPLALATLELDTSAVLVDLDEPATLRRERLRPSQIATHERAITQTQARRLYDRHRTAAGLRWWSTHESLWINVTLFERASRHLAVQHVRPLTFEGPELLEAVQFLGFQLRS